MSTVSPLSMVDTPGGRTGEAGGIVGWHCRVAHLPALSDFALLCRGGESKHLGAHS